MGTRVLIAIACTWLAACERVSTHYCEKNPMDYSHCPAPDGALVQCTGNADCPKNLPVCNTSLGVCVTCMTDNDCKDPNKPRCDVETSQCVECITGSDCTTGVCLFGGTCQTVDNTAYVDSSATADNADCSMANPCMTIEAGIAVGKPYVRVKGTFAEKGGLTIAATANVTLIADPTASFQRTDNGPVVTITPGATFGMQGFELFCDATKMGVGIAAKAGAGMYTFSQLDIHDCIAGPGGGINIAGGTVAVARSYIHDNLYGIVLTGATHFDITNNIIVHNGNTTISQAASGVSFMMAPGGDRLEFNTISDNTVKMGMMQFGGLSCPAGFVAPDNILSGNVIAGGVNTAATQAATGCIVTGSLTSVDDTALKFVNPTVSPYDYHLMPGSSALDLAPADMNITVDYDGDMRPHGTGYDYGADEL